MNDDELRRAAAVARPRRLAATGRPARVARLLEDAMSHDVETPAHEPSPEPADPRRRTPLTWLVAAAAVLVIAGVGVFAVFWGEDQRPGPDPPTSPQPSVLQLSARPPSERQVRRAHRRAPGHPAHRLRRHGHLDH